jgi:hypothetical protein
VKYFTLNVATAMFAETLDNFQHSTLLIPESLSFTLTVIYLLTCGLAYLLTLSVVLAKQCQITGQLMNNRLERMWKEAVMAYSKVPPLHLTGGTEENYKYLSQDSRSTGRDLNLLHSEYEAGVLTTRPQHAVKLAPDTKH